MGYKKINKIIIFAIVLIIFVGSLSNVTYGESDGISVYIDQKRVEFDVEPIIKDGRALVPMRKIFEELDAKVTWDGETRSVYASKDDIEIKLTIENNIININGEEIIMDIAPILHEGTTLVPLRIISESYGFQTNSKEWTISNIIKVNKRFDEVQLKKSIREKHLANNYLLDIYSYDLENVINSFSLMEMNWVNPWYRGGENLGYGYMDTIMVMNGWYNSDGHKDNLLYRNWRYHGVEVYFSFF